MAESKRVTIYVEDTTEILHDLNEGFWPGYGDTVFNWNFTPTNTHKLKVIIEVEKPPRKATLTEKEVLDAMNNNITYNEIDTDAVINDLFS